MDRRSGFFILSAILLAGVVGLVLFTNPRVNQTNQVPTPTASPSPTPKEELLNGRIVDISGPVDFMDSLLLILDSDGSRTTIYVPENTEILNQQGRELSRTQLRVGSQIEVSGTATEGGILAKQITVISLATPRPTPSASPSPSPSPSP